MTHPEIHSLEADEIATIIAALRTYQEAGYGDPANRPDRIHEIATAGDVVSLDADAIDRLCERLNCEGLTFAEVTQHFGRVQAEKEPHLTAYAEAMRTRDGDLERDDLPIVSQSDDGGAYVMAWKWVDDADAGIDRESEPENEACATGHFAKKADLNGDGYCPSCASERPAAGTITEGEAEAFGRQAGLIE